MSGAAPGLFNAKVFGLEFIVQDFSQPGDLVRNGKENGNYHIVFQVSGLAGGLSK